MTKFKAQGLNNTFKNARKGFRLVLKSELNIRIHVAIAFLVIFLALILKFSALEFCILLFVIGLHLGIVGVFLAVLADEFVRGIINSIRFSKIRFTD